MKYGFVEEEEEANLRLCPAVFPDKVGGKPAWLALDHLPDSKSLLCGYCNDPMLFLLQLYSPIESKEDCFHRTIFMFMCTNGECYTDNNCPFKVFRSQLPRKNEYFHFNPPPSELTKDNLIAHYKNNPVPSASLFGQICVVCGCSANKTCSQHEVPYCSKKHETWHHIHEHTEHCSKETSGKNKDIFAQFCTNAALIKEYNLCSEEYDESDDKINDDVIEPARPIDELNEEVAALEEIARKETPGEARFQKLIDTMKAEPDQVVRFDRGGEPIWLSETPPHIPNCEVCGKERIFEFQVTPQLLHYLKLDNVDKRSPDFGSLYVFTCFESCSPSLYTDKLKSSTSSTTKYIEEFIICQPVP